MKRSLWFGAIGFALPAAAIAQQVTAGWIADSSHGCRVWNPYPKADEAVKWEGACVNGRAQGSGTVRWFVKGQLTETATTSYRDGKMNGHVVLVGSNFSFDGDFRDNVANGQGTLKFGNGEVYSGQWVNGCFNDGNRRFAYTVTKASCGIP